MTAPTMPLLPGSEGQTSIINFDRAAQGSPEWWLNYLLGKFDAQQRVAWSKNGRQHTHQERRSDRLEKLWAYYVGDAPLPTVAENYSEVFREELRKARCNYAPMCVGAMLDRMKLVAVSTGVDSDANADDVATEIMDVSNLETGLNDLFAFALTMGEAYGMVVPATAASPSKMPLVKTMDPRVAVGEPDPVNPLLLRAFLTRTWDPVFNTETVHLFLPGLKYTATSDEQSAWRWDGHPVAVTGIDDLGGIPAVRMENRHGLGEFEPHLDLLDRINDTTMKRIVLMWYQSFRQRAVTGDLEDEDGDEGEDGAQKEPIDWDTLLRADPGSLWRLPAGVQFWESQQADLQPMLTAKRDDVKEFAAVTGTPLYLITPDDAQQSAMGSTTMREALTHKVNDRRARFTPALKLLWRIAFAMAGDAERGNRIRLVWGALETNSLADKGSATSQARGVLSDEAILTDIWDYPPQRAAQILTERTAQQLLTGATTPPPSTGAPNDNPGTAAA